MTESRSLSPAVETCLGRAVPSSQKGGTLIAEDVRDLAAHEQRLEAPEDYRPPACPRCGAKLHRHDLRPRVLRSEPAVVTEVVRFRCADRARCGAAWQVLPAFLARWLHGSWSRVAQVLDPRGPASVPRRTRRRWRARLASSARQVVAVLSTAEGPWARLAQRMGLETRRVDLVHHHAASFARAAWELVLAELAAALHRLSPGIRLV